MIQFVHKNNNQNLILFIHGFMGGVETWTNSLTGNTFPQLLLTDKSIHDNFDIAHFEYYTNVLNLPSKFKTLLSFLTKDKSTSKNLSIEDISKLLRTRLDYELIEYNRIVVIAHSMGGLIAKRTILDYLMDGSSRIQLFLSLAVPHLGSDLALYGNFFSPNIQIRDLRPFSNESMTLLNQWLKASNLPITKYFIGLYEGTVPVNSAIPPLTSKNDVLNVNENHRTISKPKDEESIVIKSTISILKDFLKNLKVDDINYDKIMEDEYSDENFVLKLLIAKVHSKIINDSKKHFYYSEEIRKIFTSASDRRILNELYAKIECLYNNIYGDFIAKKITTSSELVNEVHKKIIDEDREFLETNLLKINGLHKKGMIHQLANVLDKNIIWTDEELPLDKLILPKDTAHE